MAHSMLGPSIILVIYMSTITMFAIVPTVFRAISPPNPYKYWWLRSPDADYVSNYACAVYSSGFVNTNGGGDYVYWSYGCKLSGQASYR